MNRPALYARHTYLADAIARDWWLPGADPEDVLQEARLALWIATGTYRPDLGPFPPYARIVIKTDLRDKLQAATRGKQRLLTEATRDEQLQLIPGRDLETQVLDREHLRSLLRRRDAIINRRERDRRRKAAA